MNGQSCDIYVSLSQVFDRKNFFLSPLSTFSCYFFVDRRYSASFCKTRCLKVRSYIFAFFSFRKKNGKIKNLPTNIYYTTKKLPLQFCPFTHSHTHTHTHSHTLQPCGDASTAVCTAFATADSTTVSFTVSIVGVSVSLSTVLSSSAGPINPDPPQLSLLAI